MCICVTLCGRVRVFDPDHNVFSAPFKSGDGIAGIPHDGWRQHALAFSIRDGAFVQQLLHLKVAGMAVGKVDAEGVILLAVHRMHVTFQVGQFE